MAGSPVSQPWPRWCLSASDWSRFSTAGQPSATSNVKNSDDWSRIRYKESNRPSFCPTVASASPRIPALAVLILGSVWGGRIWLKQGSCGAQEQKTLVGLTNLRTRTPPMLPKLNRKRALFVLTKIDEILAWERRSETERDTRFVELGRYLCEVRAGQYWRLEKLTSFDEFLESPEPRRCRGE